jgi:cell division protein ZapA
MTDSFQKVSLNVHLAGRMYALTVQASQQELVRTIARELNERVGQLQLQEGYKDKQDCIAIAAMSWALDFAITQQSELAAAREIVTELAAENEKFAKENVSQKAAFSELASKVAACDADNTQWAQQLNTLHTILDAALQK